LQDVNNTGPETLPVSVCNCFLYFTSKELFDSVLYILLVVFYPSFYVVLNWNRKCFWTSFVYILQNGLYCRQSSLCKYSWGCRVWLVVFSCNRMFCKKYSIYIWYL